MLNFLYLWCRENSQIAVFGLIFFCTTPLLAVAQTKDAWTLEDSIQRVVKIAPETRAARAEVDARKGALQQAGAWPNPHIELRVDDKIGKDDGRGGSDFTQFSFSQPLPLTGRLGYQRAVASAELAAARSERRYQHVQLEMQVAQRYHTLQLSADRFGLAKQRLQLADELQRVGRLREQAGELSKLERLRLDLIREAAQQILDKTEGETNEALSRFRAYLGLRPEIMPQLTPLTPFGPVPPLQQLQAGLTEHPALQAARRRLNASRSKVDLVRARRIPDPTLRLFSERDFLNGRRQDVTGVGIGISIPLWDRKSGRLSEARAQVVQTQSELQILERDLASRLQQSYLHLNHLIEQGKHYLVRVLDPAQNIFGLTRKAYASGEVEILSLIDANNTYFNARERYLELLQEAHLEAAELRLAAGRALVKTKQDIDHE